DKLSGLHDRPARRGRAFAVCLTEASGFLMMVIRKVAPGMMLRFDNNLAVPSKAATARGRGAWPERHTSSACALGQHGRPLALRVRVTSGFQPTSMRLKLRPIRLSLCVRLIM